jgi:hypothetical protein
MTPPSPLSQELLASLPESVRLCIRHLEARNAQLSAHLATLQARVAGLEARIEPGGLDLLHDFDHFGMKVG